MTRHTLGLCLWIGFVGLVFCPLPTSARGWKAPPANGVLIWGEGWAEMGRDPGQARAQARARALAELAQNVSVTVEATLVDVLEEDSAGTRQEVRAKIQSYAQAAFEPLAQEIYKLHYPHRGQVACRLAVRRDVYEKRLRERWVAKRDQIESQLRSAVASEKSSDYSRALITYGDALNLLDRDFPDLSPVSDWDGLGSTVSWRSWARQKIGDLADRVVWTVEPEVNFYDRRGKGVHSQRARAEYQFSDGRIPVRNVPCELVLASDHKGKTYSLQTDGEGWVTLPEGLGDSFYSQRMWNLGVVVGPYHAKNTQSLRWVRQLEIDLSVYDEKGKTLEGSAWAQRVSVPGVRLDSGREGRLEIRRTLSTSRLPDTELVQIQSQWKAVFYTPKRTEPLARWSSPVIQLYDTTSDGGRLPLPQDDDNALKTLTEQIRAFLIKFSLGK